MDFPGESVTSTISKMSHGDMTRRRMEVRGWISSGVGSSAVILVGSLPAEASVIQNGMGVVFPSSVYRCT